MHSAAASVEAVVSASGACGTDSPLTASGVADPYTGLDDASRREKGDRRFFPETARRFGPPAFFTLLTLALGIFGIQRSLWLDEAWVANSVLAPSLSGMFYYPDWLQSTPPLFLLLTRAAVHVFGVSNTAFRLVPLALALAAIAGMVAVSTRLLSRPFSALACALLTFHPTTIEYSRTCKQYSGEVAATVAILLCTVLYLQQPTRRRFYWLTAAFVLTLPLAWSTVFLIPGVAIAVWAHGGFRRAGTLVLISIGVLAILYVAFIRPNISPEFRAYWTATAQNLSPGLLAAVGLCVSPQPCAQCSLSRKQPDLRSLDPGRCPAPLFPARRGRHVPSLPGQPAHAPVRAPLLPAGRRNKRRGPGKTRAFLPRVRPLGDMTRRSLAHNHRSRLPSCLEAA